MENDRACIKQHLRVTVESFNEIVGLFNKRRHGLSPKFKIAVFLFWLASGASYRVTGAAFNMPKSTVGDVVHEALDFFVRICGQVIKHPSQEAFEGIGLGFNTRAGTTIFSNAVGAIDGCHINITVPRSRATEYINRKLNYSINLLGVCDSTGKFTYICSGFPGSVHDQRVLRHSSLYKNGNFPPKNFYYLGDSGYSCRLAPVGIITPYKATSRSSITPAQHHFNKVHSKARSIIECVFGQMKIRWRCIFKNTLELKIENSIKTIVACCVMHNICVGQSDFSEDLVDSEDNADEDSDFNFERDEQGAIEFRNSLLFHLQNP